MTFSVLNNRIWSFVLLEELVRLGVEHVCVAPGSRSTPLTLEADAHPNLTLHSHFDERGLGFLALGMAKASGQPVVVIVTSGTAVANLLPAVAEANLTGERLIVLTADRPIELVECGANQAIVQTGIFSSHVTTSLSLPSPQPQTLLPWLLTSLDHAIEQQSAQGGPIHINCPFPEPLYGDDEIQSKTHLPDSLQRWYASERPYTEPVSTKNAFNESDWIDEISALSHLKGLFVLGQMTLEESKVALQLAEKLQWPILCDPQSGVSSEWGYFDLWLQVPKWREALAKCQCIIQLGSRLVSKRLSHWMREQVLEREAHYLYVSPSKKRNNPHHLPQRHWHTSLAPLLSLWLSQPFDSTHHQHWAKELSVALAHVKTQVDQSIITDPINELSVARSVSQWQNEVDLFLGNSLMVRLVDMVGNVNGHEVYSNRGASGIDGLVASAVGVQKIRHKPLVLLLGDTSLLYDLNSLALVAHQQEPFVVLVTNNDGGAIFDFLPVPDKQKVPLYRMPHGFEFYHTAQQFGLGYAAPTTQLALSNTVNQHLAQGVGGLLIEIKTPSNQASTMIKQVIQGIYAL